VKTEFNNCFIIYLKNSKQKEEAICILFVLRKKQFVVGSRRRHHINGVNKSI
jgi:hypothetical protein